MKNITHGLFFFSMRQRMFWFFVFCFFSQSWTISYLRYIKLISYCCWDWILRCSKVFRRSLAFFRGWVCGWGKVDVRPPERICPAPTHPGSSPPSQKGQECLKALGRAENPANNICSKCFLLSAWLKPHSTSREVTSCLFSGHDLPAAYHSQHYLIHAVVMLPHCFKLTHAIFNKTA